MREQRRLLVRSHLARRVLIIGFAARLALTSSIAIAGPANLVLDINTGGDPLSSSQPADFVDFAGRTFFTADDGVHGCELWATDGTAPGTTLIKDIFPGAAGSCVPQSGPSQGSSLAAVGDTLFVRVGGLGGQALWKSDGTTEGTVALKELGPHDWLTTLSPVGQSLFFTVYHAEYPLRYELWRSDGSAVGTVLIPATDSYVESQFAGPDRLYFGTLGGDSTRRLWQIDGTAGSARQVPGATGGVYILAALGNEILYNSQEIGLWATNADTGATERIFDSYAAYVSADDHSLLFLGDARLWKTDGTRAGTVPVTSRLVDTDDSYLANFVDADGRVYFIAESVFDLWTIEPGGGGERQFLRSFPRDLPYGPWPDRFSTLGRRLFFIARQDGRGDELWTSDGTPENTSMVKDINPGGGSSDIYRTFAARDHIYFAANDGNHGVELWRSDGTESGTWMVKDINPGPPSSHPDTLTRFGDLLLFSAFDPAHGRELWRSDGTEAGTRLVADLFAGIGGGLDLDVAYQYSYARQIVTLGDTAYFVGEGPEVGAELWKTDGTEAGTTLVSDIAPGRASSGPGMLVSDGSHLLFTAEDTPGERRIWGTDGTNETTHKIAGIYPASLGQAGGQLYAGGFDITRQAGEPGLWKVDPTTLDAELLVELEAPPAELKEVEDRLLFWFADPECYSYYGCHPIEIWTSDGSSIGTHEIGSVEGHCPIFTPYVYELTALGDHVFFRADESFYGSELWKGDEAGVGPVADIVPGRADDECRSGFGSYPNNLAAVGGALFFAAADASRGMELWKSDGSAPGTVLVRDINPHGSSGPQGLANVAGVALFSADDGVHGRELWRSDGTRFGTFLLQDIAPGPASSNPRAFTVAGDNVYFTADDGSRGEELWAIPVLAVDRDRCAGDCNHDGAIRVDDLVVMVSSLHANTAAASACVAGDVDGNGLLSQEEILFAVEAALTCE